MATIPFSGVASRNLLVDTDFTIYGEDISSEAPDATVFCSAAVAVVAFGANGDNLFMVFLAIALTGTVGSVALTSCGSETALEHLLAVGKDITASGA
jgi:hypothetical protein